MKEYTFPEETLVRYDDGTPCVDAMLCVLIYNEAVFVNSFWWKEDWPDDARKFISLNVNCNDCFAWGVADAEELEYEDIEDLFEHWEKDPSWGTYVWCIKKRNMAPQPPVYDDIMKGGIWNLDEMELGVNPYNEWLKSNTEGV